MKTEFGKWLLDIAKYMVTAKEINTMNPIIIYVMVTAIIAAGYLFIKYTDWKDKHAISE